MVDLDDGYTRIANELLEAVTAFDFSKRQYKVVLAVIRKTYGYGKKTDDMTISQIQTATGLDLGNCSKTVVELTTMNVLLKQQGRHGYVIGLSKNYRNWKRLLKQQPCQNNNIDLLKQQTQKKTPKQNSLRQEPRRSRRAPRDFLVTEDMRAWAKKFPGVDLQAETEKFMDHEFKDPKSDWVATWRNWIRRAKPNAKTEQLRDTRTPLQRFEDDLAAGKLG